MKVFLRPLTLALTFFTSVSVRAQTASPASDTATPKQIAAMRAKLDDWPQLNYYSAADASLPPATASEPRVVFYGASVAEFWGKKGSVFFPGKPYINRGIGGQTSGQMLARFRQDVIDLHPAAVVILEGTNDISQNMMTPQMSEGNWQSMAELAKANGIRVVFTSITPVSDFPWQRGLHPEEEIRMLNAWLKEYCASHSLVYVDFYSSLVNAEGGMKADLTVDGVHATPKGYAVMTPLAQAGINLAFKGK
jgi:lysophospholipase L1-like esterase